MKTFHTPPSLSWLIRQKARLLGELIKLETRIPEALENDKKLLSHAQTNLKNVKTQVKFNELLLSKSIPKIKDDLLAIETALSMHEIQFNQDLIAPVKVRDKESKIPYGTVTRGIYECMKLMKRPVTTTEIAIFIDYRYKLNIKEEDTVAFRLAVSKRLKNLTADGKVLRLHPKKTSFQGTWTLARPQQKKDHNIGS